MTVWRRREQSERKVTEKERQEENVKYLKCKRGNEWKENTRTDEGKRKRKGWKNMELKGQNDNKTRQKWEREKRRETYNEEKIRRQKRDRWRWG